MERRAGPVNHRWISEPINGTKSMEIHHKWVTLVYYCVSFVSNSILEYKSLIF